MICQKNSIFRQNRQDSRKSRFKILVPGVLPVICRSTGAGSGLKLAKTDPKKSTFLPWKPGVLSGISPLSPYQTPYPPTQIGQPTSENVLELTRILKVVRICAKCVPIFPPQKKITEIAVLSSQLSYFMFQDIQAHIFALELASKTNIEKKSQ